MLAFWLGQLFFIVVIILGSKWIAASAVPSEDSERAWHRASVSFTGVVAFTGVVTAFAVYGQWQTTERALKITERAELFLSNFTLRLDTPEPEIRHVFMNTGASAAIIKKLEYIWIVDASTMPPPQTYRADDETRIGIPVRPGNSVMDQTYIAEDDLEVMIRNAVANRRDIFFAVRIQYEDIFGDARKFCTIVRRDMSDGKMLIYPAPGWHCYE